MSGDGILRFEDFAQLHFSPEAETLRRDHNKAYIDAEMTRLAAFAARLVAPVPGKILIRKIKAREPIESQPGVYIGRSFLGWPDSPLGNPYPAAKHGRIEAIGLYRNWLSDKVCREKDPQILLALGDIRDRVRAGEDAVLLCWCAPWRCHGEVIQEAVLTWEF